MRPSLFEKIITREIPAEIVYEDEVVIAFMDIKPLHPGHILVVPKDYEDYIFELSDEKYTELLLKAKKLSAPLKRASGAKRIGMVVEGFGVNHVHVHLIPINNINDLDPNLAKLTEAEELKNMAQKIREEIIKSNL